MVYSVCMMEDHNIYVLLPRFEVNTAGYSSFFVIWVLFYFCVCKDLNSVSVHKHAKKEKKNEAKNI